MAERTATGAPGEQAAIHLPRVAGPHMIAGLILAALSGGVVGILITVLLVC
jgi:hypothetical protein